jgi:hypothetical protein
MRASSQSKAFVYEVKSPQMLHLDRRFDELLAEFDPT